MKRINVLDIDTSNKIAAGEVVERPSSVVKELVENSIDSKAKNITIEIVEGGQKRLKIIDDGQGIHPDDLEKAFMPHATSKINNIDDITKINTMGFRGEALASIASISNISLKSRIEGLAYGREISISGGMLNHIEDTGCNIGTTVEVKDIFFNVPARQKFLKSASRESAYISDIINRLAMANADISFKFFNNDKKSLTTYGTGKLIDALRCIYGKNICDNLIPIEKHSDIVSIYGYIGNSEISRGSRNNQSIFVNKRYIKNKTITAAVENAFKSFLTVNKFPFFVLFLDIFPEFIDVNVHPTKSEIKFSDERMMFKVTFDAVHEALRNSLKDSFTIDFQEDESSLDREKNKIKTETIQLPIDLTSFNNSNYKNEEYGNNKSYDSLDSNYVYKNKKDEVFNNTESKKEFPYIQDDQYISKKTIDYQCEIIKEVKDSCSIEKIEPLENKTPKFPDLRIIGQFHSTYILAEAIDNLYLVDQHAAHEKILFEKYKKSIQNRDVISQFLITPVVIELTPEDYSYYIENSTVFTNTGFNIEIFGDNTISIREVPMILGKPDIKNLFMDILDNLKNMGSGETWEVKYNSIATLACKSAVKAKDSLSDIEMKSLIEDLRFIDDPFTCPHGRPTIIKLTLNDLEKKFKRIQ